MFVGHMAVGLAAKRVEPQVSLGTWMLAALLADLIVFPLLFLGIEHFDTVPSVTYNRMVGRKIVYSHSLLMGVLWGALFAAAYFGWRNFRSGAYFLFGVVLSHWVLDVVSHRPDMSLAPGMSTVFGLGLWNSLPRTIIVEGGLWLLGLVLYVRATRPRNRPGVYVFWSGVALLTLAWWRNISSGMDSNPIRAGAVGLVFFASIVAWGYWMNRLRPATWAGTTEGLD
jgi:hypothetical protein